MSDTTPHEPGKDAPAPRTSHPVGAVSARLLRGVNKPTTSDRQSYAAALNRGYGEAMGRGLELSLTLLVMVGIGWIADRIFGTYPICTIAFSVLGFAGITVKLWLGYDLEMRKHEEGAIWNRANEDAS